MNAIRHGVTLALFSLVAGAALGQGRALPGEERYPARPIRLIVPFAPGGGTDIMARTFAQKFTEAQGQAVVVDNRGGGGGRIGVETAVRATPDGYTLCVVSTSYATNAAMFNLPYDPVRDIAPIALIANAGILLTVHPSVPAHTVKELIALAKAKPGALNFASTGTGGNTHLATELFNMMAEIKMTHVPYKGTGPAVTDLIGGQVQLIFGTLAVVMPHVKAGRLRAIAVTAASRSRAMPDVPAIAETLRGYEATLWYGLWGPKGAPRHVIALWNAEINKALTTPEIQARFAAEGLEAAGGAPAAFLDVVKRDVAKWIKVVKVANIPKIQ